MPVTSTALSSSTKPRMALSSPCSASACSSLTAIRASLATRLTVARSTGTCKVLWARLRVRGGYITARRGAATDPPLAAATGFSQTAAFFRHMGANAMAGEVEQRLKALGVTLPTPTAPQANYVPVVVAGSLLFVSGQLALGPNGLEVP